MTFDSPFVFSAAFLAADALRVVSFRGKERLSRPYAFDVMVASSHVDEAKLTAEAIGQPARLLVFGSAGSRAVRGVLARVTSTGVHLHGRAAHRLRLVPRLAMLKYRRNSRIFQDRTTPDIVSTVLGDAGIAHRWDTQQPYAVHGYCVQYEETDLDFIQRLLAEIGVFYHFEHPGEDLPPEATEVLIFKDRPRYDPIDGDPRLLHRAALPGVALKLEEHHVTAFSRRSAAAPLSYARRDWDFQRPLAALEAAAATPGPEAAALAPRDMREERSGGEIYEHHGEYSETETEHRLEAVRLEQLRRKTDRADGRSHCPRLLVGRRFRLDEHALSSHDGDYLVIAVEHQGLSPEVTKEGEATYQSTFSAIPSDKALRPARPARKVQQVMETAVVTGPAEQEVYTDAYGRIKVQFHWDREGKKNERSSCWIRVAQPWSGTGWGFQFIPRIGMEVLVSFLGGDLDRPVVVGCVPNATHPVPHSLPENQATSGIKTESTPGGGGFNELLFNDTKGGELFSIRAERNLTETVLHDHQQNVGHDQTVAVAGQRTTEIQGDDSLCVSGGQAWTVRGPSSLSVGGGASAAYAGARSTAVAGDDTTRIGGGHVVTAAAYSHLLIGHGQPEGHGLVYVNGNYRVGAAGTVQISAGKGLILSCGDSSIELLPGEIKLKSPRLTLLAAEELHAKGNEHELAITDHVEIRGEDIRLFAKEGQLLLDENARLNGQVVKLNCDRPKAETKERSDSSEKGEITFKLKPSFEISADEALIAVIAGPDGKRLEKEADANGEVKIEGAAGDHYVLVDIRHGSRSLSKKPAV